MIFGFLKKAVKGVFKGVKSLFKGVSKVFKKLAPVLAIGGGLMFMSGAVPALMGGQGIGGAIGAGFQNVISAPANLLAGFKSGGFGGAARAFMSSLGLGAGPGTQMMNTVVSHAGYGGLQGVATAALTGQDIWQGVAQGAPGGALFPTGMGPGGQGGPSITSMGPATAGAGVMTTAAPGGGLFDSVGNFIQQNPYVAGSLIQGLGSGLAGYLQERAARKAREKDQARRTASHEGAGEAMAGAPVPALNLDPSTVAQTPAPAGDEHAMAADPAPRGVFQYDPSVGASRFLPAPEDDDTRTRAA